MSKTPKSLLKRAQERLIMLRNIVANRLQFEAKRAASGQNVHPLTRQDTVALSQAHDDMEDVLSSYERMLGDIHKMRGESESFYLVIEMLKRRGMLPPPRKETVKQIQRIQRSTNSILQRYNQQPINVLGEEDNGQV